MKRKTRISRLEEEMEKCESEKSSLEESLSDDGVGGDYEKIVEISNKIAEVTDKYEKLYEEWAALVEEEE